MVVTAPAIIALSVVLTAAGLVWLKSLPITYESDSSVILLVDQGTKENPYTYFPRSVILTGQVVVSRLTQGSTRDQVEAAGGVRDYTMVVRNDGNQWVPIYSEPTISITATSTDPGALERTQAVLLQRLNSELTGLQVRAGVAPAIRMQVLVNSPPSTLHGRPGRAMAVIGLLSLWVSALIVRGVRRWRRRDRDVAAMPLAGDREEQLVGAQ